MIGETRMPTDRIESKANVHRRKTRKRRRNREALSPMRRSYGEVILKKGTVLYHTNTYGLRGHTPDNPMVFLTIHPSEWYGSGELVVSVVELKQDVSLLFMINDIRQMRVFSSLDEFIERPGNNLAKMRTDNLRRYVPFLRKESFDGWFSTIKAGTAVEIALINDSALYAITSCSPITWDWRNSKYIGERLIPKHWGNAYTVSTRTHPAKLTLNAAFRSKIERYMSTVATDDPFGTAFSVLLQNACIEYIDAPVERIQWC